MLLNLLRQGGVCIKKMNNYGSYFYSLDVDLLRSNFNNYPYVIRELIISPSTCTYICYYFNKVLEHGWNDFPLFSF